MVVCKFFLQGDCRFGDNCKFEHQFASEDVAARGTHLFNNNLNQNKVFAPKPGNEVDTNTLLTSVRNDMLSNERSGQWILTCYAPFKEKPLFPGFDDQSFEEVRLGFYEAHKSNTMEQYKQQLQRSLLEARSKFKTLQTPSKEIVAVLKDIYNHQSDQNSTSSNSIFGNKSTFGSMSASNMFGQNQNANQIFGQQNKAQSTVFGPQSSGRILGQPSTGGLFAQQNVTKNAGGIFGQQTTPQNAGSVFSQQSAPKITGSVFGQQNPPQIAGNVFGQQTLQSTGSVFGQPNSQNAGSVFGQPNAPQNAGNVFGQQNATQSAGGVFGQQNATRSAGGVFGQQNATQSAGGVFGQQNATSIFGQQNTGNIFAQQNAKAANVPGQSTSIFSQNAVQQNPNSIFSNANKNLFNISNTQNQQNLFLSPMQHTNLFQQNQSQNLFSSNNSPSTNPTQSSQFGVDNSQPLGHSIVSQPAQQQSKASPPASNSQTLNSIFTTQNKQPQDMTMQNKNSIFSQQFQPQPGSVFTRLSQPDQTKSVFGTSGDVPTNQQMIGNAFGGGNAAVNHEAYSKLEELSETDIEWFKSNDLDIHKMPEKPPTYEMCIT